MKKTRINTKTFILTAIVGSIMLIVFVISNMLHSSRQTIEATNEAVSSVSSFYLEAMADRRSKTITNLIDSNFEFMKKALAFIDDEGITSQEELRAAIGKIKALLSLNRFALVDSDDVVYTQYTTFTGRSRYDFLSDNAMSERSISIVFPYGSPKELCLAIPTPDLYVMGKQIKACFVQIEIGEIVSLLAFEDQGRTYFGLYSRAGENLSDTDLGPFIQKANILDATKNVVPGELHEQHYDNFARGIGGDMSFTAGGVAETLYYVPIENTEWEMAVLISESVINERIRSISEHSLASSRKQIIMTLSIVVLFATVLLLEFRSMSKRRLEAEKETSRTFRNMANTDSLTGVRNKLAYSDNEEALNNLIRAKEIDKLAVVVCDINGLKYVNDNEGHAAGDKLIKDASRLICEYFDHGAVFRIGGDEFAVLLQGRGYDSLNEDIDAFNRKTEENIASGDVVVSLGYATLMPTDTELHEMFERADQMMYTRKKELKEMGAHTR